MFRYQGIERLQLCFTSPNVCAVFLGMTILLSAGVFLGALLLKKRWYRYILLIFIGFGVVLQELLLGLTYSRGGYISFFAGILVAWLISRKHSVLIYSLTAIVSLLFIANSLSRIQSIGHITSDSSICNRLLLWRGAVGIIARTPANGAIYPGELYHAWYQPLWLNEHYRTMINDAFTLGANYGVWAFTLYYWLFFSLLYTGWRYAGYFGRYKGMFACVVGAMTCYFIGAAFSTMYEHSILDWSIISLLSIIAIALVTALFIAQKCPKWWEFCIPVAATILICSVIYAWGVFENYQLPYRWEYRTMLGANASEPVKILYASPQTPVQGRIICFGGAKQFNMPYASNFVRDYGRLFLQNNFEIIVCRVDSGIYGKQNAIAFLQQYAAEKPDLPCYVFGVGDGAQIALLSIATKNMPNIIKTAVIDASATWPFDELSPIEAVDGYSGELLLLSSENNLFDAEELIAKRSKAKLTTSLVKLPNDLPMSTSVIKAIVHFFTEHQP